MPCTFRKLWPVLNLCAAVFEFPSLLAKTSAESDGSGHAREDAGHAFCSRVSTHTARSTLGRLLAPVGRLCYVLWASAWFRGQC